MLAIPTKTRPAGSTGMLQFRDALGKFKGTSGLTFNETTGTLAFVGSAQTANNPLLDLSQAWNNAAVAFTVLRFNAIGAATSSGGSLLLDFKLDGATKFSVRRDGYVIAETGFQTGATFTGFSAASATGFFSINSDTYLWRDAAYIFAQRNGVNAQAFRVYNTYTDANNGEWGGLSWASSILSVSTANNGTGVQRSLHIKGGAVQIWGLSTFFATAGGTTSMGIVPVSNGIARIVDSTGADFGRLGLGGSTSSYPALKRSAAQMHIRLADDSAFAELAFKVPTTNPGAGTGTLWNNAGVLMVA